MVVEVVPETLYALGGAVPASCSISFYPEGKAGWIPLSCYALVSGDRLLLIDTGNGIHRPEIAAALRRLTAGKSDLRVLTTRREQDATVNLPWILRDYDFQVVYFMGVFAATDFFEQLDCAVGQTQLSLADDQVSTDWRRMNLLTRMDLVHPIELGTLSVISWEPALRVLPSNWYYEHTTGTLFASDCFGFVTQPTAARDDVVCRDLDGVTASDTEEFYVKKFEYLRGANVRNIVADFERVRRDYRINRICPSYGCIIEGEKAVTRAFDLTIEAVASLSRTRYPSVFDRFDWNVVERQTAEVC